MSTLSGTPESEGDPALAATGDGAAPIPAVGGNPAQPSRGRRKRAAAAKGGPASAPEAGGSPPPASTPESDKERKTKERRERRTHHSTFAQALIAGVAAGLTIIVSVLAYFQWRAEKTLDFQKQWSSPEMISSQLTILDAMMCNISKLDPPSALKDPKHPTDPWNSDSYYTQLYLLNVASARPHYRGLDHEIGTSLSFFSSLNSCMDNACDVKLACTIFKEDATNYKRIFDPYLANQRAIFGPDYGRDLDIFVNKCATVDTKPAPILYSTPEQKQTKIDFAQLARDVDDHEANIQGRIDEACRRMTPAADAK